MPERFSLKKNFVKLVLNLETRLQNIQDIDSLLYNVESFSELKRSTGPCVVAFPLNVIHSSFPVASWQQRGSQTRLEISHTVANIHLDMASASHPLFLRM